MPDDRDNHKARVPTTTGGGIPTRVSVPLTDITSSRPGGPSRAIPYGWKPRTGAFGVFLSSRHHCRIPFWNEFELAFARQAEREPQVLRYETRPTSMLNVLPFDYVPSFELSTTFGEMVVEISDLGEPSCDEESVRVSAIRELLDGSDIMFAQFSTDEVTRRKLFGRSRPLRQRTNDYWSRSVEAATADFWEKCRPKKPR